MMENKILSIAFMLVVHNNPEQVNKFISQLLTYEGSYVYVHVDAKNIGMGEQLVKSDRVFVIPEHIDIKWGDYTQILANNALLHYATTARHHDFYSLHSGVDMAIRPISEFAKYLAETDCYAYCEASALPNQWQYGGGIGRVALHWPAFFRKRYSRHSPMRYLRSLYGKMYGMGLIKGKKLPKEYELYGGADWFTISGACATELLSFVAEHPDFQNLFINSLSGAEVYYVTLFEMLKKDRTVMNNRLLRYINWGRTSQKRSVGAPNTITMDFVDKIEQSGDFFARKFDANVDSKAIEYFLKKVNVPDVP